MVIMIMNKTIFIYFRLFLFHRYSVFSTLAWNTGKTFVMLSPISFTKVCLEGNVYLVLQIPNPLSNY